MDWRLYYENTSGKYILYRYLLCFEYEVIIPYAVKVEGYGNTRNQRSLFQFAHVTITEHMVNAKYWYKDYKRSESADADRR